MRSVKTMGEMAENRRYAQTSERGNWFIAMALPVLVMFAIFQKQMLSGYTKAAMK